MFPHGRKPTASANARYCDRVSKFTSGLCFYLNCSIYESGPRPSKMSVAGSAKTSFRELVVNDRRCLLKASSRQFLYRASMCGSSM